MDVPLKNFASSVCRTVQAPKMSAYSNPEGKEPRNVAPSALFAMFLSVPSGLPGRRDRGGRREGRRLIRDSDNMGWVEQQPADRQADM